jgi:Ring finger domain
LFIVAQLFLDTQTVQSSDLIPADDPTITKDTDNDDKTEEVQSTSEESASHSDEETDSTPDIEQGSEDTENPQIEDTQQTDTAGTATTANDEETGVVADSPASDLFDTEESTGFLKLRRRDGPCDRAPVPNMCAVCLEPYQVGDEVVWSSTECPHVFHQECMVDWFMKINASGVTRGTPCPCCRQEFTDMEEHRLQSKILWQPDRAMDLSTISFR